jgi:hypothetical protein
VPLTLSKSFTEEDVAKLAKPVLLADGTYAGQVRGARETKAQKSGRDMIVITIIVVDSDGNERELPVYLHTGNAGLQLLRHACVACNAELKFNAGLISAEDFPGHDVRVVVGTEKKGKWPARNVVLDILPADTADVVPIRAAE